MHRINEENYRELISEFKLDKKSNILVTIPTFNSFKLTSETIESFLKQEGVIFDILITGPSGDIERLVKLYPQINYCITKGNYGSSGNQLINILISKTSNYEYTLLSENDAYFLHKDGLKKLYDSSLNYSLEICGASYYDEVLNEEVVKLNLTCLFHCFLFKNEVFDKIKLFDFNYFLTHDDFAFCCNVKECYSIYKINSVKYYHPNKINVNKLDNFSKYLYFRSSLIGLLYENFKFRYKLTFLRFLFVNSFIPILYSIVNFDLSFFKIIFITLNQFVKKNFSMPLVPKERYSYIEIAEIDSIENNIAKISFLDRIFLPKFLCVQDLYKKNIKVYEKVKNY